eukprot:scaffold30891_cov30-Tisochrysis_lutea.AAC.1
MSEIVSLKEILAAGDIGGVGDDSYSRITPWSASWIGRSFVSALVIADIPREGARTKEWDGWGVSGGGETPETRLRQSVQEGGKERGREGRMADEEKMALHEAMKQEEEGGHFFDGEHRRPLLVSPCSRFRSRVDALCRYDRCAEALSLFQEIRAAGLDEPAPERLALA